MTPSTWSAIRSPAGEKVPRRRLSVQSEVPTLTSLRRPYSCAPRRWLPRGPQAARRAAADGIKKLRAAYRPTSQKDVS